MNPKPTLTTTSTSNQPTKTINPFQPKQTESNPGNFQGSQSSKQNPFMMPPIIRSEQKEQRQAQSKPQKTQSSQPEKQILSRTTLRKVAQMRQLAKKKKPMPHRQKPKDLSLIHQESGEYYTSSESGLVSDSSINESGYSESEGSQYWQSQKKWTYDDENQSQGDEDLDKTVVMTRNKPTRPTLQVQKGELIKQKLTQHNDWLKTVMQQYSPKEIHELYQQGKIKEIDYKRIHQMKNEQVQTLKEKKFLQNLEKNNKSSMQIFAKFTHLRQKLMKDVSSSQLKYKELLKKYQLLEENFSQSSNPYNPDKLKFQLKLFQKQADIKAKESILSKLTQCIEELSLKFTEHATRLDEEKTQNPNFSDNLIFREISDFIKYMRQLYNKVLCSMMNNKKTGKSPVSQMAYEFYMEKLKDKYHQELLNVRQNIFLKIFDILKDEYGWNSKEDFPGDVLSNLFDLCAMKINQGFETSKKYLHENISFLEIVLEQGKLSQGKIYQTAVETLEQYPLISLTFEEVKERYIVENFKFFNKKVHRKMMSHYELINNLHVLFQTRKQAKHLKSQQQKQQQISSHVTHYEKLVYSLDKALNLCYDPKKSKQEKLLSKYSDVKDFLEHKRQNLQKLSKKVDSLLRQSQNNQTKKSLLPQKRTINFDFRSNKQQLEKQQSMNQSGKTSWKQLLSTKPQKISQPLSDNKIQRIDVTKNHTNNNNESYLDQKIHENQKNFASQMSEVIKTNTQKLKDSDTQKHFDKVFSLMQRNQINIKRPQEHRDNQPYQPQYESIFQQLLDSIQISGHKPAPSKFDRFDYLYNQGQSVDVSKSLISTEKTETRYQWLNPNQSIQQIQAACQLFARQFHRNPALTDSLALNDHQFHILMSPDYRKHFMDKKVKDKELTDKIVEIVRLNTKPNQSPSTEKVIKYMIESDEYFRQRIEEYQHKIIKQEKIVDPNDPRLWYDWDDLSTCDSQENEILDRRIKEMEEKSMKEQYFRKLESFKARNGDYGQEIESNDCDIKVIYC